MRNDFETRRGAIKGAGAVGGVAVLTEFLKVLGGVEAQAAGTAKPQYGPTPGRAVSKQTLPVLLKNAKGPGVLSLGGLEVQKTQYIDGTSNGRDKGDIEEVLGDISGVLERSGLGVIVRKIVVLNPKSPKLKPNGYGVSMDEHRMNEALATTYINRDGLEINFSSGNSPRREREFTTMHEVGHGLDPELNPYLDDWLGGSPVGDLRSRAEQEYRAVFPTYLERGPGFSYEHAVVASKTLDVGQKTWPVFVDQASGPLPFLEGSTHVISESRIAEAAKKYPDGSVFNNLLSRRARIGTPDVIKGFSARDLGLGLVVDAISNLSGIERDLGGETALVVKQSAKNTIEVARREMYAELFAQQMVDGGSSKSFPLTRELQSFIVSRFKKLSG